VGGDGAQDVVEGVELGDAERVAGVCARALAAPREPALDRDASGDLRRPP
jgi:uncharacterized membrane-anchored protein